MAKYKLMVSYGCGCNYELDMESDNIEDFKERCDELDKQILRWSIEDEEGKSIDIGGIQKKILTSVAALNKAEEIVHLADARMYFKKGDGDKIDVDVLSKKWDKFIEEMKESGITCQIAFTKFGG
jgi:hypothetical protein